MALSSAVAHWLSLLRNLIASRPTRMTMRLSHHSRTVADLEVDPAMSGFCQRGTVDTNRRSWSTPETAQYRIARWPGVICTAERSGRSAGGCERPRCCSTDRLSRHPPAPGRAAARQTGHALRRWGGHTALLGLAAPALSRPIGRAREGRSGLDQLDQVGRQQVRVVVQQSSAVTSAAKATTSSAGLCARRGPGGRHQVCQAALIDRRGGLVSTRAWKPERAGRPGNPCPVHPHPAGPSRT